MACGEPEIVGSYAYLCPSIAAFQLECPYLVAAEGNLCTLEPHDETTLCVVCLRVTYYGQKHGQGLPASSQPRLEQGTI
jgi:hypothetical protein